VIGIGLGPEKVANMTECQHRPVRVDLLKKTAKRGAPKLGVTANTAAHTNELIAGVVLAAEDVAVPVDMVWRDDHRDAETAQRAAQSFVQERVVAVVGHLSASAALPASKIYAGAGVPFLAPGTTHPAITELGSDCVFRVCGRDDEEAQLIADLIERLPQRKLIGIIEQDIPYGRKLADLVRAALAVFTLWAMSRFAAAIMG